MPGLLAVCWPRDRGDRARQLFATACDHFVRLKTIPRTDHLLADGLAIARFAGPGALSPALGRDRSGRLVAAVAGWWFDRAAAAAGGPDPGQLLSGDLALDRSDAATAVFDRMDGQFAALLADLRHRRLHACCDRPGMFPVYVHESGGLAWISTSAAVLAATLGLPVDGAAARALYLGSVIRPPRTAFVGVRRLLLGEEVALGDGRARVRRAWVPHRPTAPYRRIEEAAEDGVARLREVGRHLLAAYPDPVCDLTAGLDSRLVVAALATVDPGRTFGVSADGEADHLDVVIGRQAADRFGWAFTRTSPPADWGRRREEDFRRAVVFSEGELAGDCADRALVAKVQLAARHGASINGGLGEMFRDFFWWQEGARLGRTSQVSVERLLRLRFVLYADRDGSLLPGDWRAGYLAREAEIARAIAELEPGALNTAKLDALYLWKNAGHVGRYLAACAPVIPGAAPLATRALFEFATAVPHRFRRRGRLMRHMITAAHPDLARLPTWYGGTAEPFSLRRPHHAAAYAGKLGEKYLRRILQLVTGRQIIKNPAIRHDDPRWHADFVQALGAQGLLAPDGWRSAGLYADGRLDALLVAASRPGFRAHGRLYQALSLELLCRELAIEAAPAPVSAARRPVTGSDPLTAT